MKLKKQIIICLLLINGIGLILPKHFTKPFILDVPLICQYPLLPTGCESVGATMLLQYYGIDIDEITFASYWLKKSSDFYEIDGIDYGPNPYKVFAGDPFSKYSYGCFSPVIQDAINHNQNQYVAIIIQDKTLEELCKKYIDNNHPVLIWATMRMTKSKEGNSWYLNYGDLFKWTSGEHCLVLVGYDDYHYYLNDPETGTVVKYKKELVQRRFEELNSQSIVLEHQ